MSMETFIFNKLVRDKIVPNMLNQGVHVEYRSLVKEDLLEAFQMKAEEELHELKEVLQSSTEVIIGELADLKEVFDSREKAGGSEEDMMPYLIQMQDIMLTQRILDDEVKKAQENKNTRKGSFTKGYFVAEVSLDSKNDWYDYIAEHYEKKE